MRLSPFAPIDRWLAPAPDPARVAWIGEHVFAHRGLHGPGVPENAPSECRNTSASPPATGLNDSSSATACSIRCTANVRISL